MIHREESHAAARLRSGEAELFGGCNPLLAPSPGTHVCQSIHSADACGAFVSMPNG